MEIGFELPQSSYPCLLHRINEEEETFHCIFEEHDFSAEIPYLSNKFVFSCRDGWWVVQDYNNEECIFILNPRSMERIELPKIESSYQSFGSCILSDSPQSPHCRVILFNWDSKDIFFCKIGDAEFTKHVLETEIASVVVVGGRIYGLSRWNYKLVSFSFEGQNLESREVIKSERIEMGRTPGVFQIPRYLVESNDELLLVDKRYSPQNNKEVVDFKIHKMDSSSSSWTELSTLGYHRALFLDGDEGISYNLDGKRSGIIQGNCIYYVDPHSGDINIYHLKDGSFQDFPFSPSPVKANSGKLVEHEFRWVTLASL